VLAANTKVRRIRSPEMRVTCLETAGPAQD
jgi:hypothetical protein